MEEQIRGGLRYGANREIGGPGSDRFASAVPTAPTLVLTVSEPCLSASLALDGDEFDFKD